MILKKIKGPTDKANEEASPCTVLFKAELIKFTYKNNMILNFTVYHWVKTVNKRKNE